MHSERGLIQRGKIGCNDRTFFWTFFSAEARETIANRRMDQLDSLTGAEIVEPCDEAKQQLEKFVGNLDYWLYQKLLGRNVKPLSKLITDLSPTCLDAHQMILGPAPKPPQTFADLKAF